jgi:hypothetical protein
MLIHMNALAFLGCKYDTTGDRSPMKNSRGGEQYKAFVEHVCKWNLIEYIAYHSINYILVAEMTNVEDADKCIVLSIDSISENIDDCYRIILQDENGTGLQLMELSRFASGKASDVALAVSNLYRVNVLLSRDGRADIEDRLAKV